MNSKVIGLFMTGLVLSSSALAASEYGMAGCGLGAIVFRDQPGIVQIFAGTTNGTFGSQTFGISSGSSNCYDGNAREEASLFITINQEALKNDISKGTGETLVNLSQILKCEDADRLGMQLQKNYRTIFSKEAPTASEVTQGIDASIKADQDLMRQCGIYS